MFHSILTDEIRDAEGKVVDWLAVQPTSKALEWFSE